MIGANDSSGSNGTHEITPRDPKDDPILTKNQGFAEARLADKVDRIQFAIRILQFAIPISP
jgi:hypothetical protein